MKRLQCGESAAVKISRQHIKSLSRKVSVVVGGGAVRSAAKQVPALRLVVVSAIDAVLILPYRFTHTLRGICVAPALHRPRTDTRHTLGVYLPDASGRYIGRHPSFGCHSCDACAIPPVGRQILTTKLRQRHVKNSRKIRATLNVPRRPQNELKLKSLFHDTVIDVNNETTKKINCINNNVLFTVCRLFKKAI